jgi:hypothetical protein
MIERAHKLAFDFTAALAEDKVAAAAAGLRIPTLVMSGGLSPYLTQRIAARLASLIEGATIQHLPGPHAADLARGSSMPRISGISPAPTRLPRRFYQPVTVGLKPVGWRMKAGFPRFNPVRPF